MRVCVLVTLGYQHHSDDFGGIEELGDLFVAIVGCPTCCTWHW
jgi:hypothetical protein